MSRFPWNQVRQRVVDSKRIKRERFPGNQGEGVDSQGMKWERSIFAANHEGESREGIFESRGRWGIIQENQVEDR